jgi:hypothetical protein
MLIFLKISACLICMFANVYFVINKIIEQQYVVEAKLNQ